MRLPVAPSSRAPYSRYLRPPTRTPVPPPLRRGTVIRLAPALLVLTITGIVLLGGGFWSETQQQLSASTPMETIVVPPNGLDGVGDPSPGLDGQRGVPSPAVSVRGAANYLSRPAMTITTVSQQIETVRAKRNETVKDIASRTNVGADALLWANSLTDPDVILPVGLVVKVPPKGTMLHHIRESDTLETIARAYRVTTDAITNYPGNNVKQTADLVPGEYLIVPSTRPPMREKVVFYQVRPGDTLSKITATYGLRDPQTLKWANSLNEANLVQPGQVIAVPPTDGVIHVVEGSDTQGNTDDAITQIAKNFACASVPCLEASPEARVTELREAIFNFGPNHLTRTGRLIPGQELVIPGGIPFIAPPPVVIPPRPTIDNPVPDVITAPAPASGPALRPVPRPAPSPSFAPAPAFPGQYPSIYYPPQGAGSGRNPGFVWPETGVITSTYNSVHNGIDVATPLGTPLHAAAAGYVVYAAWTNSGLGNAVYIDHGNGFVTIYGHMANVAVKVGQYVQQGEFIGPEGSTGNSTGPHIHFMIIENNRSVNPFNYLP